MSNRRNSLRYPGYDYRHEGAVFVTVCVHDRHSLFGAVRGNELHLTAQGKAASELIGGIEARFPGVMVDMFVVMPDHIHMIVMTGTDPDLALDATIGDIIAWFKIRFQAAYRKNVASGEWRPYRQQLWQRDFHDRIIRSERELEGYREYIEANPARLIERLAATDGIEASQDAVP